MISYWNGSHKDLERILNEIVDWINNLQKLGYEIKEKSKKGERR